MGYGNIKRAWSDWPDLPDLHFRVFLYMCHRSLDNGNPPVYKGGWEELSFAMGRRIPDHDPDDRVACRQREQAKRAVMRVIQSLVDMKAISLHQRAAPHRPAHYAIHLDRLNGCHAVTPVEIQRVSRGDTRTGVTGWSERVSRGDTRSTPPTLTTDYSTEQRGQEDGNDSGSGTTGTTDRAARRERASSKRVNRESSNGAQDAISRAWAHVERSDVDVDNGRTDGLNVRRDADDLAW